MRDVIGEMRWGMMGGGICGTDHLSEIGPAVLPFLVPPPPAYKGWETGTANDQRAEKECLFCI